MRNNYLIAAKNDEGGKKSPDIKRIKPIQGNNGWKIPKGYNWQPSQSDIELRDKSMLSLKQKMDYINSPVYRKRLLAMGETNPDNVIKERTDSLKNVEFFRGAAGASSTTPKHYSNSTAVTIAKDAAEGALDHELGHVTSNVGLLSTAPNKGGGAFMSPIEAWKIINSDKNITVANKKRALGSYLNDAKNGNFMVDPTGAYLNGDEHEFGAGEAKGDLDAMRGLFQKHGYTKKYGEQISPETLKRALNDPKIKDNPFIKRLQKRFDEDKIINLNNTIAATNNQSVSNKA